MKEAPEGDGWVHEVKFDGYRMLCRLESAAVTLLSRNGKDWTEPFGKIAAAAERLRARSALLDGEVVAVRPDGTSSFNALQNALSGAGAARLAYYAFDLLHLDGEDLTGRPLEERKASLRKLLPRAGTTLFFSDHVVGKGRAFLREACGRGLEGIVSKRRGSPYRPGRGGDWVKTKCFREQEFVIGGFTDPEGQRTGIGALLLGVQDGGGTLAFAGKVGTGFTEASALSLRVRLDALERSASPFAKAPRPGGGVHFVAPRLVGVVRFTEWTSDGKLRHPSFQGLREDKAASEVVRERARGVRR